MLLVSAVGKVNVAGFIISVACNLPVALVVCLGVEPITAWLASITDEDTIVLTDKGSTVFLFLSGTVEGTVVVITTPFSLLLLRNVLITDDLNYL